MCSRWAAGSAPTCPVADVGRQKPAVDERPVEVPDVDVMLSMLAAEHRQSDPAAGIAERLEDKSTRIAVMVGGMVLIGAVVFLVLTVLGAICLRPIRSGRVSPLTHGLEHP